MKLPMYQKTEKGDIKSDTSVKQNKNICEIENSIEIELNCCPMKTHLIPFLILSWIPILLMLLYVHNQKLEVAHLKTEMRSLNAQLHVLRRQVEFMRVSRTYEIPRNSMNEELLKTDVLSQGSSSSSSERKKRDASEDMPNDFKQLNPSGKISAKRIGKGRRHKLLHAQRRRLCQRCLRANNASCSGLQAIHLKGAHPETFVEAGHIGPWFIDSKAVKDSKLYSSFQLREDSESVEVQASGLYFIYAQVYYLTSHPLNSFTIKLVPKESDNPIAIAFCSTNSVSGSSTSEISCFTASVQTLQAGDRIYVQQREKNRRLIMRPGHSFLGLVRLGEN